MDGADTDVWRVQMTGLGEVHRCGVVKEMEGSSFRQTFCLWLVGTFIMQKNTGRFAIFC